jgi:WD40 repeat protein
LAVVAGWDRKVRVYDTATMAEVAALDGHDGYVTDARFTSDGNRLVTASTSVEVRDVTFEEPMVGDGSVRVWELASQDEMFYLRPQRLWRVMPSDDGRYLFAGARRGDVNALELWDVDEWCKRPLPPALEEQARSVKHEGCCAVRPVLLAISADAHFFATVMYDVVSFWDAHSGSLVWAFATGDATQLDVRIGGPDPFAILAGLHFPPIRLDIHERRTRWRMGDEFIGAEVLCLCPDARRLVVRLPSREIAVICSDTGSSILRRTQPSGGYWASWSAGMLALDYEGDGAELVDGATGEHLATLVPSPARRAIRCGDGLMYRAGPGVALAMDRGILLTGKNYACVWERVA